MWSWYEAEPPSLEEVDGWAATRGDAWRFQGVHKWIAYDRVSGEVVGRGGLSRAPVDADWGQLYAFLPDEPWVREAHPSPRPFLAHANWLELGWALRGGFRGRGYATEIGRAGLEFAFDVLGVQAVVSIAIRHNRSSRAVMERLGMRYAGRDPDSRAGGRDGRRATRRAVRRLRDAERGVAPVLSARARPSAA